MRKLLIILLAAMMLSVFTACDDSTPEANTIPDGTKGEDLKDLFTSYAGNVTVDGDWVVLGMTETKDGEELKSIEGPAIKFKENGVTEFGDDGSAEVSFTLDLSGLDSNEYTAWSLNYGDAAGDWVAETYLFIQKTNAHSYTIAWAEDGITHTVINYIADADDMHEENIRILNAAEEKITITDDDDIITISLEASKSDKGVSVKATIGNDTVSINDFYKDGFGTLADITGIRTLWNVISNSDSVKMTAFNID